MDEAALQQVGSGIVVAIHGRVYDLTDFAVAHPGGSKILLKYHKRDASADFDNYHSLSVLESLPQSVKVIGTYIGAPQKSQSATPGSKASASPVERPADATAGVSQRPHSVVSVDQIINNREFPALAEKVMTDRGWVYYSGGAEDEETLAENMDAFQRYIFCPRVCVDVSVIDTRTTILGYPCSMPLMVAPTALQGLAHADGEVGIARAAHAHNVIQIIPTFSSRKLDDIATARAPGQVQFFQLYVNTDRSLTEALLRKVVALGIKAVFVTVDAPSLGRREKDMRLKYAGQVSEHHDEKKINRSSGVASALTSYIARNLTWADFAWIKKVAPELKLVAKGIQRADDALRAVEMGCDGMVLSNHGGRQVDCCRAGVDILAEVVHELRERGLIDKVELYVDGGIWRGRDVAKCLILGARAVAVGRPIMYGLAAFGQPGAEKSLQIYRDELQNAMSLLGASNLSSLSRDLLRYRNSNTVHRLASHL